jgi:hypothetical protein
LGLAMLQYTIGSDMRRLYIMRVNCCRKVQVVDICCSASAPTKPIPRKSFLR